MSSSDSDTEMFLWEDSDEECGELVQTFWHSTETAAVTVATLQSGVKRRGGSVPGRQPNLKRNFQQAEVKLFNDYFAENPIYGEKEFCRRFRMCKQLFEKVVADVERKNPYFVQKPDAVGKMGLSARQKCTAAMRLLAYGICADSSDECLRLGESTALQALKEFCATINDLYGATYLRSPNAADIVKLLAENETRGFPGMLGSLDCTHWTWKNCPTAWTGQFMGKEKKPTIILEAVASKSMWIWHAFFGMPGSCNDINVLDRSPIFQHLYNGTGPSTTYEINGRRYDQCYFLADGIYPPLATLVQTIASPVGAKRQLFAQHQEAARKDVERAFGVLKGRFAILAQPARLWYTDDIKTIMRCCIILHNLIIESNTEDDETAELFRSGSETETDHNSFDFTRFLQRYASVHDSAKHHQLRNDLIEHIWKKFGKSGQ